VVSGHNVRKLRKAEERATSLVGTRSPSIHLDNVMRHPWQRAGPRRSKGKLSSISAEARIVTITKTQVQKSSEGVKLDGASYRFVGAARTKSKRPARGNSLTLTRYAQIDAILENCSLHPSRSSHRLNYQGIESPFRDLIARKLARNPC